MIKVDGIILVISCHKHLNTRLKEFQLPQAEYGNWKVIYVIGDLRLDCDYKLYGNLMVIKCEDSYIHLLKKVVLSFKYLYEVFDIKEGILRAGDDLIFNENSLCTFLNEKKEYTFNDKNNVIDYMGISITWEPDNNPNNIYIMHMSEAYLKTTINDNSMVKYYNEHPEDIDNPLHNLNGIDFSKYTKRPHVPCTASGVLYYISNKSCNILINHLHSINYDIFHYDEYTDSYPYTIEDCSISYILHLNKICFIHYGNMYSDNYIDENCIACHTNKYK